MKHEDLILEVFTWNCAGEAPHADLNLAEIILPQCGKEKSSYPHLIVIGLQEIVKLNARSVIAGKNRERN